MDKSDNFENVYIPWGQKDYDDEIRNYQKEEEDKLDKEIDIDYSGSLNLEELKQRNDLSEKQMKTIDKLQNLLKAIHKVFSENERLLKKENDNGELTQGQKKRLEMNKHKLDNLNENYQQIENNLKISLSSKDGTDMGNQRFDKQVAQDLNSDDEYFDRVSSKINEQTGNKTGAKPQVITENYETLKHKLEELIKARQKIIDKLSQGKSEEAVEEMDPLDKYFYDNENAEKSKLTENLNEISKEITKTQKLLSLVVPSHIKIKFKPENQIPITKKPVKTAEEKIEPTNDKKRSKESIAEVFHKFNKMQKRREVQTIDKKDQAQEEVDNNNKSLEIDEEFKEKLEQFKKSIAQGGKKQANEDLLGKKGGLIIGKEKDSSMFNEIISNIHRSEFDISNYSNIKSQLDKKEEETSNVGSHERIDYSKGGLQVFREKKEKGVVYDLPNEEEYLQEFTGRKRERTDESNKQLYGPNKRDEDKEEKGEEEENEYDVFNPYQSSLKEQSINENPLKKYKADEEND